jgi:hypothetical protein
MARSWIGWSLAFALVLALAACGDDGSPGGSGGTAGHGGTAGSGASGGSGGVGGAAGGDCARICESPCVTEYLPAGALDDCERSCAMGFFTCVPELVAALDCIEALGCDSGGGSSACVDESEAFTNCVLP